jgi:hypothetical protein
MAGFITTKNDRNAKIVCFGKVASEKHVFELERGENGEVPGNYRFEVFHIAG